MSNERFTLLLVGVAVLAAVALVSSGIKIPGPGLVAFVMEAITDSILTEPAPADSAPVAPTESAPAPIEPAPTKPAPVEPAPTAPTGIPNFTEVLETVTDAVKNFLEPAPVPMELAPAPIPAVPKGISRFKILIVDQDTLESKVNDWLAVQQNIVVDEIKADTYEGGAHLVVIGYHTGGGGNTPTRLKLIGGENPEADAEVFLSSLNPSQTVRSVAAVVGSYSSPEKTVTVPLLLIVYE